MIESSAVQLCARKVASVAGDARTALDVCRRAVETVESDTRRQLKLGILSRAFYTAKSATLLKLYHVTLPMCFECVIERQSNVANNARNH